MRRIAIKTKGAGSFMLPAHLKEMARPIGNVSSVVENRGANQARRDTPLAKLQHNFLGEQCQGNLNTRL
jgi:hypothetical protein